MPDIILIEEEMKMNLSWSCPQGVRCTNRQKHCIKCSGVRHEVGMEEACKVGRDVCDAKWDIIEKDVFLF